MSLGRVAEKNRLCRLVGHVAHHPPDGVDEADVEHPVDLVQHHHLDPVEPDRALAQMVDQAAGRGDQDVDAARHDPLLAAHVDAAEDDGGGQPQVPAVGLRSCPRSGWRARASGPGPGRGSCAGVGWPTVGGEPVQDRQRERRGLAGAGLGDAQEVAAGQDMRDRLRLDRRRRGVALGRQGVEQRGCEAEIGKLGQSSILSHGSNGAGRGPACPRGSSPPRGGLGRRPACLG